MIGLHTSADLPFTTPPEFCCNCGTRGALNFIGTPLQRTRYFFLFGTELTLRASFAYCKPCEGSATRVRLGWLAKILATLLVTSIVFMVLVFGNFRLPALLNEHVFRTSLGIATLLTLAYFYFTEWSRKGGGTAGGASGGDGATKDSSTYYQPVSLIDADVDGDGLHRVRLRFNNAAYARVFKKANAEYVAAGALEIES